MSARPARGMAETLYACLPIPDVAKSLPMAALSAAGALPQSVTRCLGTPSNHERHQGHRRVVQTLLAIDPGPAVAAMKLPKRRTWPRQLPLGVGSAATRQPSRHGSGIEVGGLAAHGTIVERWRKIPTALDGPGHRPVPDDRRRLSDMQRATAGRPCKDSTLRHPPLSWAQRLRRMTRSMTGMIRNSPGPFDAAQFARTRRSHASAPRPARRS